MSEFDRMITEYLKVFKSYHPMSLETVRVHISEGWYLLVQHYCPQAYYCRLYAGVKPVLAKIYTNI